MHSEGEVTRWIRQLQAGQREAAGRLWERYHRRLIALARARLAGQPRRAADEEDVVLSAFDSFCRGAEQGRFPRLEDRDDLWQLLVVLTVRKASDLRQHETRQKRGGSVLTGDDDHQAIDEVVGTEPTPAFAAQVAEQCRLLLEALPDDVLRSLALGKLEGYTNPELAEKLSVSRATVERKLAYIRAIWQNMKQQSE